MHADEKQTLMGTLAKLHKQRAWQGRKGGSAARLLRTINEQEQTVVMSDECVDNPVMQDANAQFYQNKIKSYPSDCLIEEMLKWYGDYARLDKNHCYMQWLFPLPETSGTNSYAQKLTQQEMEEIILHIRLTGSNKHLVFAETKKLK